MTTLNISPEQLESEIVYYSTHAKIACEELQQAYPNFAFESIDKDPEEQKSFLKKMAEKIKAFFKWVGEVLSKFIDWVTGRKKKEEQLKKDLDKIFEDISEDLEREQSAQQREREYEQFYKELARSMNEAAKKQADDIWSQAKIQAVKNVFERYEKAKDKITDFLKQRQDSPAIKLCIAGGKKELMEIEEFITSIRSDIIPSLSKLSNSSSDNIEQLADDFKLACEDFSKKYQAENPLEASISFVKKIISLKSPDISSADTLKLVDGLEYSSEIGKLSKEVISEIKNNMLAFSKMTDGFISRAMGSALDESSDPDFAKKSNVSKIATQVNPLVLKVFESITRMNAAFMFPVSSITLMTEPLQKSYESLVKVYGEVRSDSDPTSQEIKRYLDERFPKFKSL